MQNGRNNITFKIQTLYCCSHIFVSGSRFKKYIDGTQHSNGISNKNMFSVKICVQYLFVLLCKGYLEKHWDVLIGLDYCLPVMVWMAPLPSSANHERQT